MPPLTRAECRKLQGTDRCPWRIIVGCIIKYRAAKEQAALAKSRILYALGTPEGIVKVNPAYLVQELQGVHGASRKARMLVKFSKAYLSDDWDTILDLPGVGKAALQEVERSRR